MTEKKRYLLTLNVEGQGGFSHEFSSTPETLQEDGDKALEALFGHLVCYVTTDVGMHRISFGEIVELVTTKYVCTMFDKT